jgi:hypothetical protein
MRATLSRCGHHAAGQHSDHAQRLRWSATNAQVAVVIGGPSVEACLGAAVLWGDVPGLSSLSVAGHGHGSTFGSSWRIWRQMSARPDLPIQATHPPRHCRVGLERLQRAQALGGYQDHLVIASATGLMNPGHPRPPGPSRSCRSQASRCPGMPPASSTSGRAHGVLSHAMSPVYEDTFDLCASTQQSASTSLCHDAVTPACKGGGRARTACGCTGQGQWRLLRE